MFGPGRYDDDALELITRLQARGVVLVVLDGPRGLGSSCKVAASGSQDAAATLRTLAALLRASATGLETDAKRLELES